MMEKRLNAAGEGAKHNFQDLITLYEEVPSTNVELDPRVSGRPTPLDPESLNITASRGGDILKFTYPDYVLEIEKKLLDATSQEKNLPPMAKRAVENELEDRMEKSVSYGSAAYKRLTDHIDNVGLPDNDMLRIIQDARVSKADPKELLRLIKEYPDIISLEVLNFVDPLRNTSHKQAVLYLDEIAESLRDFRDAEVEVLVGQNVHSRDKVVTDSGVEILVNKDKIADIRSVDSHTELIRKRTYLTFGEGGQPHPIGTSAYFRPADYRSRLDRLGLLDSRQLSVYSHEELVRIAMSSIDTVELARAGVDLNQYAAMVSAKLTSEES